MPADHLPLFLDSYLRSEFDGEVAKFQESGEEQKLLERLEIWATREMQNETSAQNAFVDRFFKQLWGYWGSGERPPAEGYTCYPQFAVGRAGAMGGTGQADLALGYFGIASLPPIPQALCEFKDIRSGLDSPQRRKGNTRSPVQQCNDYLREAFASLSGMEPVQPHWGIVTEMNEFRLYRRVGLMRQYQRFVIVPKAGDDCVSLLSLSPEGTFQRLIFCRLFHRERLITRGGDPLLVRDLKRQNIHERSLEDSFYAEYKAYREELIGVLRMHNPQFTGTPGKLVRLAQTILDRCIFVLFCEDMGRSLSFPKDLVRDLLERRSADPYYDEKDEDIWEVLKRLFAAMNNGGPFGPHTINRFNGGLFARDAQLESLHVPNRVFCRAGQNTSASNKTVYQRTLLYFASEYNFGTSAQGRTVSLYALGRIFEQSITELEALEAEAEGRPSLTKITKRKRDGVYYTPEGVIEKIVAETLGARLAELRLDAAWDEATVFSDDEIKRKSSAVRKQLLAIDQYRPELENLKVVDPACGSGAFLIYSLEFLLAERRRVGQERERLSGEPYLFDTEEQIREILSRNIYGVDINPASIEITRLALWLHTARADRPLCDLNRNVRDGNSLISPAELGRWKEQMLLLPPAEHELINPFDWEGTFPEVFERGGFDCVVGNPPYVKLQNFRRVMPKVAEFLREATAGPGQPLYRSAQSGNFDMFLPFIEKGIALLNPHGRMGFIAPSLWLLNEYGEGLRELVYDGQNLDRWLDFKSFQVFNEVITYTALQFFTRSRNGAVRFANAPDGAAASDWNETAWHVPYNELSPQVPKERSSPGEDTWVLLPEEERRLVQRLAMECKPLGAVAHLIVGIQTSADHIYHLKKLRPGVYESYADKKKPVEIKLEDGIMRPLVSGAEVDRYVELATDTYLLFPYAVAEDGATLMKPKQMEKQFPKAWGYLLEHEKELRARDSGKNDDDERWWGYIYPKNLDKHDLPKLAVPRLAIDLYCAVDAQGKSYLDNVDVGGVILEHANDLRYIAALLNSPVLNFIWRRLSKPFQNNYRSANKQFIAPLPIPVATARDKQWVGERASALIAMHTRLRELEAAVERRLSICEKDERDAGWVLPELGTKGEWRSHAPKSLRGSARVKWATEQRERRLEDELHRLQAVLGPRRELSVLLKNGELIVSRKGMAVIDKVFVAGEQAEFVRAQWQTALWRFRASAVPPASRLVDALRKLKTTEDATVKKQVADYCVEQQGLRKDIELAEAELNRRIYALYHITPQERAMIEAEG